MNFSVNEITEIAYKLDTNNNGYVDYTEFIAGCMKSKIYLKEDHLKTAFSYFDKVSSKIVNYFRTAAASLLKMS